LLAVVVIGSFLNGQSLLAALPDGGLNLSLVVDKFAAGGVVAANALLGGLAFGEVVQSH
jgi:hypothetical protein